MLLETRGAHITGCFTIQQGLRGGGSAARASAGIAPNPGTAVMRASGSEARPTKNAATTIPISRPPAPSSDETGTGTGSASLAFESLSESIGARPGVEGRPGRALGRIVAGPSRAGGLGSSLLDTSRGRGVGLPTIPLYEGCDARTSRIGWREGSGRRPSARDGAGARGGKAVAGSGRATGEGAAGAWGAM